MKQIEIKINKHTTQMKSTLTAGKSKVMSDEAKEQLDLELTGIDCLAKALQAHHIGYLDPTSDWCIRQTRQQLANLPPVPLNLLKVGGTTNGKMYKFCGALSTVIAQKLRILQAYVAIWDYDMTSIPDPANVTALLSEHPELVTQKIQQRQLEISDKIANNQNEILNLTGKTEKLWDPPRYCVPCGFFRGWWRYARVTLPDEYKDVEWWTVKEELGPHTSVSKTFKNSFPDFDVQYVSDLAWDCVVKVTFYVQSHHIPAKRDQIKGLKDAVDSLMREKKELSRNAEQTVKQDITDIREGGAKITDLFANGDQDKLYDKIGEVIVTLYLPPSLPQNMKQFLDVLAKQVALRTSPRSKPITAQSIPTLSTFVRNCGL
jgi:hypothetical protein